MDGGDDDRLKRLRQKAEVFVRELKTTSDAPPGALVMKKLLHELQVHQIELELQNDELRQAQEELERSYACFFQLFHKAPVGYLVLDSTGIIRQANETFCGMVGQDSAGVTGKPFSRFISEKERAGFAARYRAFFKNPRHKNMELSLWYSDRYLLPVRIEAAALPTLPDPFSFQDGPKLLVVVSDITEQKNAREKIARYTAELETLNGQLEIEMDKARQLHQSLLPRSFPRIPGLSFAAYYQPAQRLGGDFYDVLHRGNRLVFYLSDVSGHGLDGAMLSVFIKYTVKNYVSLAPAEAIKPAAILDFLAEQFCRENYPEELFICAFVCVLNLESMELSYSQAGFQDTPFVRLGDGRKLKLAGNNMFILNFFLGLEGVNKFTEGRLMLTPGSTIFLNTDGLSEQGYAGLYYVERLEEVFFANAHLSPQEIARAVTEDFRRFNGGSLQGKDDITFLILQLHPSSGSGQKWNESGESGEGGFSCPQRISSSLKMMG